MSVAARELVGRRLGKALAVEAQATEHPLGRFEAQLEVVDRVEERLLVLLEVLRVGERQPMHDSGEDQEARGDPGRLGSQQLGRVGVLLLGHDARARGEVLGQLAEGELVARPEHDLGSEAREVHGADRRPRTGSRERSRGWRPRRSSWARPSRSPGHPRALPRSRSQFSPASAPEPSGSSAARFANLGEAPGVSPQHPEVGQQVVPQVDGLGALEVRVAGHRPVGVALGQLQQAPHQRRRRAPWRAPRGRARTGRRRWPPGRFASGRCGACLRAAR